MTVPPYRSLLPLALPDDQADNVPGYRSRDWLHEQEGR